MSRRNPFDTKESATAALINMFNAAALADKKKKQAEEHAKTIQKAAEEARNLMRRR